MINKISQVSNLDSTSKVTNGIASDFALNVAQVKNSATYVKSKMSSSEGTQLNGFVNDAFGSFDKMKNFRESLSNDYSKLKRKTDNPQVKKMIDVVEDGAKKSILVSEYQEKLTQMLTMGQLLNTFAREIKSLMSLQ